MKGRSVDDQLLQAVWTRQGGKCQGCGKPVPNVFDSYEQMIEDILARDHIPIYRWTKDCWKCKKPTSVVTYYVVADRPYSMGDVEKLCERVMVINGGRLLFDGDLEALRGRWSPERELVVDFDEALASDLDASFEVEGAQIVERDGRRLTYRFQREGLSASSLIGLLAERHRIADLTVREPEIESTIRRFYEDMASG